MDPSTQRSAAASSSPEFEFCVVDAGNHHTAGSSSSPQLFLTADELFYDGLILPLHHLSLRPHPAAAGPAAEGISAATIPSNCRKESAMRPAAKEKEHRRRSERKAGGGGSSAELNIHIWPFVRSRSAGSARPGRRAVPPPAASRNASSAPCSRSNSRGERPGAKAYSSTAAAAAAASKLAADVSRPAAVGVHLSRTAPVWRIRRDGGAATASTESAKRGGEEEDKKETQKSTKKKRINPYKKTRMGYESRASATTTTCRADTGADVDVGGGAGNASGLARLKTLFTKKVY